MGNGRGWGAEPRVSAISWLLMILTAGHINAMVAEDIAHLHLELGLCSSRHRDSEELANTQTDLALRLEQQCLQQVLYIDA